MVGEKPVGAGAARDSLDVAFTKSSRGQGPLLQSNQKLRWNFTISLRPADSTFTSNR